MRISRRCHSCRKTQFIEIGPLSGYAMWEAGTVIQKALPNLSAGDREMMISGTCSKCFDEQFKGW